MEPGGDDGLRIGLAEQHLRISAQVDVPCPDEVLARALAIRPIVKAGRRAEGGDRDRAVLAVIGDVAAGNGARTIRDLAQRVH
ncbi:hypothetical protein DK847_18480 [Aestuariivirga litoralis]|uniref:Uncharacterized protein n=1 Tax=Aestuariivirga litoralis TaxID=2650924 RepID=A0A2W2AJL3_9HYPH|nr:hypothetical protein DK847_18480 [Aestuariivirga litoralis]